MSLDLIQPGAEPTPTPNPQAGSTGTQTTPPSAAPQVNPPDSGEPELEKLDTSTQAYIQKLRKENAKYRTEAKSHKDKLEGVKTSLGIKGEEETLEQRAQRMAQELQTVAFEKAVYFNAVKHAVPEEGMEFFQFLLDKERHGLNEGEELAADKIAELAKKAKAGVVKPAATTTVVNISNPGGGASAPPPAGNNETLTVEKFATMGFNEKCRLYETNPELYSSLMKTATQKRLLK
jgi:hypothetical protein